MKLRILGLLLAVAGLSGCFWPAPPEDAEVAAYEGTGSYRYVYYPDYEVYYYEPERVYYWNDGGYWRYGTALPRTYPEMSAGVTVQLNSPRPYMQHQYVVTHYGRGYRHGPRRVDHETP